MAWVVGVAGATGSVGGKVLAVLDAAPWRPSTVIALASPGTHVPFVPWGDGQIAVDDARHADIAAMDLLIVATPDAVARDLVTRAVAAEVPVVDLSGSQREDLAVPVVLPWVNAGALDAARAREVVAIPGAPATLIATALAPLVDAGWKGTARAEVMVSASSWGREGIEELSKGVVALFNAATPPRKVFEQGLAFDLIPAVGAVGGSGWTGPEALAMAEIARLCGVRCDVTLVGAPLFQGIAAALWLELPRGWDVERVAAVWKDAGLPLAEGARKLPRPRRVDGSAEVHIGRLRASAVGEGALAWLVADNAHLAAVAAVGAGRALLPGRAEDDDGED
jgi:aspartate-semialdehyde dehydrogenase